MFTGIIEEVGTVADLSTPPLRQGSGQASGGGRLRVECRKLLPRFAVSSSVAVNGCCLTVVQRDDGGFWCDLAPETLRRTGFRRLRPGARVNLEAPLRFDQPLGGHLVQGHVDGTGTFVGLPPAGDGNYWLEVDVPPELARYLVEKGSVTVEGISLTVAAIEGGRLRLAIVPYTWENTNLRTLEPGDPVNLECDVLAKYLEKLLAERPGTVSRQNRASRLTVDRLHEEGF